MSYFGDIREFPSTSAKRAFVDTDVTYKSNGSIAVCFEDLGSDVSNGVTYGISILGTPSNHFGSEHCTLQNCPDIRRNDGSIGPCCKLPSMVINYSDPPITDFTWNGEVYKYKLFENEKRANCKKIFGEWSCGSRTKPGSTILHEFMHVLGAKHEHLNPQERPFKYNVEKVYATLCPTNDPSCIKSVNINWLGIGGCQGCVSKTDYDPNSIMTYSIPSEFIEGSTQVHDNYELSVKDKQWLDQEYPPNSSNKPTIEVRFGNGREWQKAWFSKMLQENFGQNVNLKFVENPNILCGVNTPPANMPLEQIFILVGLVVGSIVGLYIIGQILRTFLKQRQGK